MIDPHKVASAIMAIGALLFLIIFLKVVLKDVAARRPRYEKAHRDQEVEKRIDSLMCVADKKVEAAARRSNGNGVVQLLSPLEDSLTSPHR